MCGIFLLGMRAMYTTDDFFLSSAQTDIFCYTLRFELLDKEEGLTGIKMKILTNLGASLSFRLRTANKELASFT